MIIDVFWFKKEVAPFLVNFEIEYKFFEEGDFGALNQVEFNSKKRGGEIDFWSSGWLSIHLVDYIKEEVLLNVFLKPEEYSKKEKALKKLQLFLNEN